MAIATMRVPTLFTAVDRFSDVVTRMTAKSAQFGKTSSAAALRASRQFDNVGNKMLGAGIGIATGIGYAVNEAAKFEKSISNISTLTENTPEQMKYIGDRILQISKTIPIAISDMTSGMYDVVSAGITGTANQLNVLDKSGRLAVAGLGTTKEAVNIMTSSLNAFGIQASDSQKVANLLMKTVKYGKTTVSGISESFGAFASIMKNSNVTLEEYLASAAALTTTGMSMSRAQTQVSSATTALIKPNKTMSAIYEKLGVKDVPTFIKKSGGLVGALTKVDSTAKTMGVSMSKVMGRKEGLSALLSLLGAQKGKFKEIMTDMASGADIVNIAFAKQQATLSAKIQIMKNELTVLAIRIGEVLIPRVKGLLENVLPVIENFTVWNQKNSGLINTLMSVAKWLLIFGIYAKLTALILRGYAFALTAVTWLTETYATVTRLLSIAQLASAVSGQSLAVILWELVVAEWAALAPILLVVAALGLLTYAFWDLGSTTDKMVGGQVSSLDKSNSAWINSTNVMSRELGKQKRLTMYNTPSYANGTNTSNNILGSISKRKEELKAKVAAMPPMKSFSGNLYNNDKSAVQVKSSPENLAGNSQMNIQDFLKGKSGKLDLNITAPSGYGADVIGTPPSGIEVNTKPNQGVR